MSANFCLTCGTPLDQGMIQCPNCGRRISDSPPIYPPMMPYQDVNRPLGTWDFFWIRVLCGLPIIGIVFILIWSFDGQSVNRRNLARSMVISWLAGIVLALVLYAALFGLLGWLTGEMFGLYSDFYLPDYWSAV